MQGEIETIFDSIQGIALNKRIEFVSAIFLNTPFRRGDGVVGNIYRRSMFNFEYFDCLTFVEIVICISLSSNFTEAKFILKRLRYKNDRRMFTDRNYLIHSQWVKNNQKKKLIRQIFLDMSPELCSSSCNLRMWLINNLHSDDRFSNISAKVKTRIAEKINRDSLCDIDNNFFVLKYININNLSLELVNRIPSGTLIAFVQNCEINHIGFIVHCNGSAFIRHCGQIYNRVTDDPLSKYVSIISMFQQIQGVVLFQVNDI